MANESREIVRVAGQAIAAAAPANDWRALVARFIAEQDTAQSSRALYTRTLTQFFVWLQESKRLQAFAEQRLERTDILCYKDSLLQKGLSPLTIGSYIVVVRKFFAYLESSMIYPNIAKGVKAPKKEKGFRKAHLTDSDSRALLQHEQ